jgi:hypothetical protein
MGKTPEDISDEFEGQEESMRSFAVRLMENFFAGP